MLIIIIIIIAYLQYGGGYDYRQSDVVAVTPCMTCRRKCSIGLVANDSIDPNSKRNEDLGLGLDLVSGWLVVIRTHVFVLQGGAKSKPLLTDR